MPLVIGMNNVPTCIIVFVGKLISSKIKNPRYFILMHESSSTGMLFLQNSKKKMQQEVEKFTAYFYSIGLVSMEGLEEVDTLINEPLRLFHY